MQIGMSPVVPKARAMSGLVDVAASRRRRAARPATALLGATLALTLLLTGCTGGGGSGGDDGAGAQGSEGTTAPTDSGASDAGSGPDGDESSSPLMAQFPEQLIPASAEAETVRVADEIQALLDPATILYVDDHPQLVDATAGGQYFGVLRILSLTETTDPVLLAKVLAVQLKAAGWTEASVDSTEGSYFVALISSDTPEEAWILQLGGDTSAEGNGAITVNLLSPTFS
jgi:hypothetical protein